MTAAILAGGRARRLGGVDKCALTVGNRSILERQLAVLEQLGAHVLIVANDVSRVRAPGIRVVPDRVPGAGALGGLYTALMEASTDQVLVLACDMPFLTLPFLSRLAQAGIGAEAVVPRDARGRHPLCASYARHVAPRVKARIDAGELRVLDALTDFDVREIGPDELAALDPTGRVLLNLNTPDDYTGARAAALSDTPDR